MADAAAVAEDATRPRSRAARWWGHAIMVIVVAFATFHLYTASFGILEGIQQRVIHLAFALVLIFLSRPLGGRRTPGPVDLLMIVATLASSIYLVYVDEALQLRMGIAYDRDIILGTALVLVLLEATRRATGWALPIIAALSIAYAFVGPYLPRAIGHRGFGLEDVSVTLYLTTEGIFSIPLTVSATYIALFIILGAVLQGTGAAKFFSELAYSLFGTVRGGPGKVAIVASGLFGMISGSAVANVASTGVLTIPLMRRTGFSARFAGAVEAVASSCGQFMPPIMASAAFVIAETLAIPYLEVAAAALIPAILYYAALFVTVDLRAAKLGLRGEPRSALPDLRRVVRSGIHLMLVPATLVVMMAAFGYSPMRAAVYTIAMNVALFVLHELWMTGSAVALRAGLIIAGLVAALIVIDDAAGHPAMLLVLVVALAALRFLSLEPERRPAAAFVWQRARVLIEALRAGAMGALDVAVACATAGIIIGMLMLTGMGLRLSGLLVDVAGNSLPLLLVLTMVASLILGMGVPTLGAYVVLAVLVAPSLVQLGVEPLAAHLFIFYFGVISVITPPVCMGAFAAAAISGAHPMKTGLTAFRLGITVFIVPYIMVYHPAMILDGTPLEIAQVAVTGLVGAAGLAAALEGYLLRPMRLHERLLAGAGGILLITGDLATDIAGAVALGLLLLLQTTRRGERPAPGAAPTQQGRDTA